MSQNDILLVRHAHKKYPRPQFQISPQVNARRAGAAAAFTVDLLVYPVDTLKTRLQAPSYRASLQHSFWKNPELFRGLYQGIGSVILATLPASGVFFTTYETLLPLLGSSVLASSIGEAASCAIITPAEVIKQNAQVLARTDTRMPASIRAFQRIGVRNLWRGYGTLVGRNLPFTAMQFPVFEALKKRLIPVGSRGVKDVAVGAGLSAGIAGSIAAVLTTPIDVVKTRVMLSAGVKDTTKLEEVIEAKKQGRGSSVKDVVREVVKEEGFKGFWRGGALRGVWALVGSGLYLGSYEGAKVWLRNRRERKERELAL